ncbi:adenosylcobinamide-GDP ribazoletransferase [uncultured Alsobacter sp.]|uniref:adenosylcobinamide-GDP ribazoletransferase n=1 Tax=uncultured Alsobacter sp. TaxID=1748258 RepID=UPI0025FF7B15|nr:adenosylcobinamide-GDP ribazoletransferase [uncultured Alsobacter sp.]
MAAEQGPVGGPSAGPGAGQAPLSGPGLLVEVAQCLRFYSRLPVPRLPGEADPHAVPDFTRIPRALPLAGAVIGLVGALVLALALALRLPPAAAAALAVAALVLATGAFHEDGLADTADGFGGGRTVQRRLEIMSDSRVGTYGATAIGLSLILRVTLVAAIAERLGAGPAGLALVAVASATRVIALAPLWLLPPAKPDGRSASVGRPSDTTMATAAALAVGITLLVLTPAFGLPRAGVSLIVGTLSAWPVLVLSRRLIGGQTGDVAGATQQVAEIAMLAVLASRL